MENSRVEMIDKVLESYGIEWAALCLFLSKKGYDVVDSKNLQQLKDAHYDEVGTDGWRSEFDL